jgi:hypothetical protein
MHMSCYVFSACWILVGVIVVVYIRIKNHLFRKHYGITKPPSDFRWRGIHLLVIFYTLYIVFWPITLLSHWLLSPSIERDMLIRRYFREFNE